MYKITLTQRKVDKKVAFYYLNCFTKYNHKLSQKSFNLSCLDLIFFGGNKLDKGNICKHYSVTMFVG